MMEPVITHTDREPHEQVSIGAFSEMFQFLSDEWKTADTYLEQLGFPAQTTDEFGQFLYQPLTQRIRLALGKDEED
jgi:hypothetical protein